MRKKYILFLVFTLLLSGCTEFVTPAIQTQEYESETFFLTKETKTPEIESESSPELESIERDSVSINTVIIWHSLVGKEEQAIHEVISSVKEKQQSIHIILEYLPYEELLESYRKSVSEGNGPSLLIAPGEWRPILHSTGQIIDLTKFSSVNQLPRFNPAAIDMVTEGDSLYGLPFKIRGVVMYRNSLILPIAVRSFDELVATAQNATQGRYVGSYLDRGDIFGAAHLSTCGGEWTNKDGSPGFNNQDGLCWLELLQSFEEAGPVAFDTDDDFERFSARNVAVIIDGTWNLDELSDVLGDYLVIDPWPAYGEGRLSGFVWADCVYINNQKSQAEQEIAWNIIEHLVGKEAQIKLSEFGQIPAVLDAQVTDPHIQQAMFSLSQGVPYPVNPEIEFYWEPLNAAVKSVFEDGVDPVVALQVAYDQIIAETTKNR
jgi:maltose-binding protein MalE